MTVKKSKWVTGRQQMPTPMGSEVVNVLLDLDVAADEVAENDLYIMGELPEDCALVDVIYGIDQLDSDGSAAAELAFGVVNDDEDDLTTTLEAGIDIAQAGGAARMTPTNTTLETKSGSTGGKRLGFKVTTAAATGKAGTVRASVSYRSVAFDS